MEYGSEAYDEYTNWVYENKNGETTKKFLRSKLSMLSRSFVKYEATLHNKEVEDIWADAYALKEEASHAAAIFAEEMENKAEDFGEKMEGVSKNMQEADQKAAEETIEYFLTHIELDGTKLKDIIGGPEQWMLQKNVNM